MSESIARSDGIQSLARSWQKFATWWLSELRKATPAAWPNWLNGDVIPRVLIRQDHEMVACALSSPNAEVHARFEQDVFSVPVFEAWLLETGFHRKQVLAGAVIEREQFFLRDISVPTAALGALPTILEQEILRRTPFPLDDIWHGASVAGVNGSAGDVLSMHHWIIRRDRAAERLSALGLSINDVDFLAARNEAGETGSVISFRTQGVDDPPWATHFRNMLAAAAVAVVFLGLGIVEWCQSNVANTIEVSLAESRAAAFGNNSPSGHAARLYAMKADPGLMDVWDELSGLLPDHTFLTEFRINDGKVVISGFSADAARLVRLIDKSSLFSSAVLASAITADSTEQKDRFSIGFKLRDSRAARSPARTSSYD